MKIFQFRTPVPTSAAPDDSSRHPAVPQHPQDVHLHQVLSDIIFFRRKKGCKGRGAGGKFDGQFVGKRKKNDRSGERLTIIQMFPKALMFRAIPII